jgi:adenosine deaminase
VSSEAFAPTALRTFTLEMPKAELHVHLDGAIRVSTALQIARSRSIDAPRSFADMSAALVAPETPATEAQLLTYFQLPVRLMQDADALERVTHELVADKAADRVRYLEIKWAPLLHTEQGMRLEEVLDAVCAGAEKASSNTGCIVRLICVAVRSHPLAANIRLAQAAAKFIDRGLTGFDFAGSEEAYPNPLDQVAAFDTARREGLRITLHAGDLPSRPELVRQALELRPERIAHGVSAAADPGLCDELRERGVALDMCPTSNVQSGSVASLAAHPMAALHRRGVCVTLSTDDPTISAVSLSDEYVNAMRAIGLTPRELWAINLNSLKVAFADEAALQRLRDEFQGWAANIPELIEPMNPQAP